MADKFPELDVEADGQVDGDFLAREQQLLGDEFKTEQDQEALVESDDEIQEFKEQFPEVGESEPANIVQQVDDDDEFEGFGSAPATTASRDLGESDHVNAWKERRNLEIEERERVSSIRKEELVNKAQEQIDDFYDNYNNKKEEQAKEVLKEEETFLKKRDEFLKHGTLWDRVNELVGEIGEVADGKSDKSRFKDLLTKLKGKENVPGAGGY